MSETTIEKKDFRKNGVRRLLFVAAAVFIATALLIESFLKLNEYFILLNYATRILGSVLVLGIYSQYRTASMKMPWIILILAFPVMGVVTYLLVGMDGMTKRMRKRFEAVDEVIFPMLDENEDVLEEFAGKDPAGASIAKYLKKYAFYPTYRNNEVKYYPKAEDALEAQLSAMSKAEQFIFMEYHAIEDKVAWSRIEAVLRERAKQGVEIRLFYDDIGSLFFIDNRQFIRKMQSMGIKCRVFNPVAADLGGKIFLNNRDHRKITVVDGKIGFTGGFNLADEYFNITHPYGMWRDTGIEIHGNSVKNFTAMFLEMWNAVSPFDADDADFSPYLSCEIPVDESKEDNCSFVTPYADSPMDKEQVGEEVYISMLNKAEHYCYFTSPYLIITDEMSHAMTLAAKRGIDVRIVTPGIPDKKLVYSVTRSFYHGLARCGVRIYEWTPGFTHAKMCVADDKMATCGTINLDYRSLYHHFENGCFLYGGKAVQDIKADFDRTFGECEEVTEVYHTGRSKSLRFGQLMLRLVAQLL
ncbi:MAG: cardiolipin synthase [Lachnospiraceae bacterium]|nr:cardiolipin synthase [Lachnospiraceae bacterium]